MIKDINETLEPLSPQSESPRVTNVETTMPRRKTGERRGRTSVERPIRRLPKIAPKPKRLKMFAEVSLEKCKQS